MIKTKVKEVVKKLGIISDITLLTPKDERNGDFAINIHQLKTIDSTQLTTDLSKNELFENAEQVGSFINLTISRTILFEELQSLISEKETYGSLDTLKKKKIVVEFAHPNTHKLFHIGHLRNISLGEALSRLLIANGADVIRANYQGDVGLHIAKCLYSILKRSDEIKRLKTLYEKITFLGSTYTQGTVAYETDKKAKEEIHTINKKISTGDAEIKSLWNETRSWSLEYYDLIYKRVGTKFDRLFFESEVADTGLAIAKNALKKGILDKSDGAVIFKGKKYGVDTRVFINSLGLPTYEAKELGLGELEFSEFGRIDRCIHVVTPEQSSYFKVAFKVQELLDPQKYKDKQMHFAYEFVDLKGDKMSSRKGNILTGEWLLEEVKKIIQDTFSLDDKKAEIMAVGAVKYAFLKVDAKRKIVFDIAESISIHGNSGPYIQYTYARCMSILKKVSAPSVIPVKTGIYKNGSPIKSGMTNDAQPEELSLLRTFYRFPEVVEAAATNYSPHLIATYLFDLTQKFNTFYEKCPILKAEKQNQALRLLLTKGTAQLLKNGLYLLGINVLEQI